MTDITANEYRTAAKVDRFHGGQSAAQFYEDNARALESEDLVTQVAMQFAGSTWGGRDAEEQFALAGSERALAYLVGAGRLIPAGGMALTAEQVEDLRKVLDSFGFNQVAPEVIQAIEAAGRLNRALLPATEPATSSESQSSPKVEVPEPSESECPGCKGEGDSHVYPAPAEPAEEETKAEACAGIFQGDRVYRCALADGHYGDHTTAKGEHWQKRPASSPVVPAPTETGPWA